MRLAAAKSSDNQTPSHIETIQLSSAQTELIALLSTRINPDMPLAFGKAHVVRTLLEKLEQTGVDLSSAKSEDDIAGIAAAALQRRAVRG